MSSVCSSWRNIAIGTRQLWSYVYLGRPHCIDYAPLWLNRAGDHPLSILNVIPYGYPRSEERTSRVFMILPRMKHVRSMVLRSDEQLMDQWMSEWISEWFAKGTPRTLTTLALSASVRCVRWPPVKGETINQLRLDELLHSLDTLYLDYLRVNWKSLRCHNLVNLYLINITITIGDLRHVLNGSPNLQYIHLLNLNIPAVSESAALLPVQLHSLRTLDLKTMLYSGSVIAMIATGECGITLRLDPVSVYLRTFEQDFVAFCGQSNLKTLHCRSFGMPEATVAAGSNIEVLCLEGIVLDHHTYDLIAPRTNVDSGSSLGHRQSRLPCLRSLHLYSCILSDPEGLRRVVSAGPIREIGIDGHCGTDSEQFSGIDDFKKWLGPEVDTSFVMKKKEPEYSPFR